MKSVEATLLRKAKSGLDASAAELFPNLQLTDARLEILEVASSLIGGWDPNAYRDMFRAGEAAPISGQLQASSEVLLTEIKSTEIPVSLALSSLAREEISVSQQRKTGAYYTDWRLAQMLAGGAVPKVTAEGIWVDPSCGTGILLAAAALCVPYGPKRDSVIKEKLTGADLTDRALRGALLSVASLTHSLDSIAGFASRLLRQDSLLSAHVWSKVAPNGAALVIGNPPWEKLRVSRHEVAQNLGESRHYGQSHSTEPDLTHSKQKLAQYLEKVAVNMQLQGTGEHDLYKLFLELGIFLVAEDGILALLTPAGLIRSQGTETLRRKIDDVATQIDLSVIENRARHFSIDTRFKFLALIARIGNGSQQPISLRVADRAGVLPKQPVKLSRPELRSLRPDLSIPEVRVAQEWDLYRRLAKNSVLLNDPSGPWQAEYRREVDMTIDRSKFVRTPRPDTVPILEGRHISQFRWRAKSYISGEGRAAIWHPEPMRRASPQSQWHISQEDMRQETRIRIKSSRVGFCDITGQTNERSFLAARVPMSHVCGNKVPTLVFEGGRDREDLFIAIANSFVVDWVLRRLVTTTVNFFLLKSLPLPDIDETTAVGARLLELSRELQAAEGSPDVDLWKVGQLRAEVDALVAHAWGLSLSDLEVVLRDFPLIDRGQPIPAGDDRSKITTDALLNAFSDLLGLSYPMKKRLKEARELGALPYVPAEYA